jgi:phenylacetate-CoA ligase
MENLSLRECDLVISSDPVISNYIERRTGKSSFFLPNGYDPLFSQVRFHEGRPLAERRNIIIFVGKIDLSVYRLDILLVAAREVVDRIPDAIFRFVGAGRDLARLKRLAGELGVERAIDFVGSVPHENVASLLRESKVCIHLTNDTCLGQKVMEYMASGKPVVIASPWWRKYKVLLKNGYNCVLVPLDAGMVATAILKVMRNQRLAARLSINAFNTARRHTWDNVAARLYDVMRNKRGFRSPRLGEAE